MHPARLAFLALNVLGGIAVLGSYAHGIATHADAGAALWGGVPIGLRPLYGISMCTAAVGYFLFAPYVAFGLDPKGTRTLGGGGYWAFLVIFGAILGPSAVWMPLTFAWRAAPSGVLWVGVRAVLGVVGVGAVGLIGALVAAGPVRFRGWRVAAIAGSVLFAVQTAVLDAVVWPAYYR